MKRKGFFLDVLRLVCSVGRVGFLPWLTYVEVRGAVVSSGLYRSLVRSYWKHGVPQINRNLLTLLALGEAYGGWERLDGLVKSVGLRRLLSFLADRGCLCVSASAFKQWLRKRTRFRWALRVRVRRDDVGLFDACCDFVVRHGFLPLCRRHADELRDVFLGFEEFVVSGFDGREYVVFSWGARPSEVSFCFVCSLV